MQLDRRTCAGASLSSRRCIVFFGCAAAVAMLASAGRVEAQSRTLQLVENNEVESSFTLDFSDLGFSTQSRVISTRFRLDIDETAGTARFLSYDQVVEPLILPGATPDQGISTGEMTIRIPPGSSSGTYNPRTRTFTTNDTYEISFTGDLSAFGLTSPVLLPSTSVGSIEGGVANAREIDMNWSGIGQLDNPAAPSMPLRFNYTSHVNTLIDQPAVALTLNDLFSSLCGGGMATLMPLMILGMWSMKHRRRSRRRACREV